MPGPQTLQRQPEPDYCTPSKFRTRLSHPMLIVSIALAVLWLLPSLPAQTHGTTKATPAKPHELRALGVLEWTGEEGKPSSSRLIPIALYTGETYQDASLYLARPEPLAVQRDTEYELLRAGIARGRFDIFSAANVEGSWFGYGVWKPIVTIKPPKLAVSKTLPTVVKDVDPDRPHFSHTDPASTTPDSSTTSAAKTTPAPKDTPQLSTRAGTETNVSSTSDDPERPKLRKRQTSDAAAQAANESPEEGPADPDRPKLHHGKPEGVQDSDKLTGTPPKLQQMVALSTTANEEPHPYTYQWASPDDETKMQAALEKIAREAAAAQHAPSIIGAPVPKTTRTTAKTKAPVKGSLTVDDFRTFELSYSGGATMVFSCRIQDESGAEKFVTIIAQPDFYGAPKVLLKQVTDAGHLDITPRMKLIDAADTNGDHRAELIFELHGNGERRFAIYNLATGRAEQVFLTSAIP